MLIKNKGTVVRSLVTDFQEMIELPEWKIPSKELSEQEKEIQNNAVEEAQKLKVSNLQKACSII